jgi:hypothetical protein
MFLEKITSNINAETQTTTSASSYQPEVPMAAEPESISQTDLMRRRDVGEKGKMHETKSHARESAPKTRETDLHAQYLDPDFYQSSRSDIAKTESVTKTQALLVESSGDFKKNLCGIVAVNDTHIDEALKVQTFNQTRGKG